MNRAQYRRTWLRLHKRYERKGLAIFRKRLREAATLPFENISENNYLASIVLNVSDIPIQKAYEELYMFTGLIHGKKIGREINKEIRQEKNFTIEGFEENYRRALAQWLINNGGTRITSVKEELVEYLIKFISERLEAGTDIRTIARQIEKHILHERSFYRWQIERIVRTETTAAANFGAIQAGESSGVQWEKEWISSNDSRTRRRPKNEFDHIQMDGVRVDKGENFDVQGDSLSYPGDPKGQPANTINCRCSVAVVPKRDEQGRIVFTTSQGRVITF